MKHLLFLLTALIIALTISQIPAYADTPAPKLTEAAVKNSDFPLPRLSSGYDLVKFSNGTYKKGEKDAKMSLVTLGQLNGQPAAVVYVGWSTGGSGWWEELGLYRMVKGKAQCVGLHGLEDRAKINSIRIAGNQVVLDWTKHGDNDSASSPTVHELKKLKASDFVMPKKD